MPSFFTYNQDAQHSTRSYYRKTSENKLKVIPTTFWLKRKSLLKCTKFCSTRKLEVAAKNVCLLTKNCLMH